MGHFLFLVVIGSGLCIIAPLVLILAVVAFILTWLSLRYRVLYLYTRKIESGGQAFPLVFQRMMASLVIMSFCTACGS
jgi:Flp pilus assembly protein TadB